MSFRIDRSSRFYRGRSLCLVLTVLVLAGCTGSGERHDLASADYPQVKREPITQLSFVSLRDPTLESVADPSVRSDVSPDGFAEIKTASGGAP